MSKTAIIDRRFCGPPGMGNGGYVCGVVAQNIGNSVKVTLRRPAPLDDPLTIETLNGNGVILTKGNNLIAEAHPVDFELEIPAPPTFAEATVASQHYPVKLHPFPACFVCGPQRAEGDGLRIFPTPIPERKLVAAPWIPNKNLATETGKIKPEYIWAALDCPGGVAAVAAKPRPILLGQLTAAIVNPVQSGEQCIIIGWLIATEGRKHITGTAVFSESGRLYARGKAVWIEPN